ncbi:hypothetical protein QOZ88_05815 [Blastococcus sp. BMG 814]|uniref:Uncharacterized protein n=1 Tax=Blastococcus carthaginiensis TaxID=3050034 RepID=A0ABT9I995_9ACTN|nr:hypothetical protein [Blastococcus carthaginiensis]MDP5182146.1 hypothetical protein [Blastococcus carthaginiensis]
MREIRHPHTSPHDRAAVEPLRPEWADERVVAEISLQAGGFMALLLMGRERGLTVEQLAELTRLRPETVTALLTDWPIDAVLAAKP